MRGLGSLPQTLRKGLRAARNRLLGEPNGNWLPGFPEGLTSDEVAAVCDLMGGGIPQRIRHEHLSAWKQTGASRIHIELAGGVSRSFVFKRADYGIEQIPALTGLPVRPGFPEYQIYSSSSLALAGYLPRVYRIEQLVARERYHYFLEDLASDHRVASGEDDLMNCARQLPAIHLALQGFCDENGEAGLLRFDDHFWQSLLVYAAKSLDRFQETTGSDPAGKLSEIWPALARLRQRVQDQIPFLQQPIHGDSNFSNLLLPISGDRGMKVLDWEWAGVGLGHSDLASLLKGQNDEVERNGVKEYALQDGRLSDSEHWLLYQWCQIERSVFDAAFLATQSMDATHSSSLDLHWCVENSSKIALRKSTELEADLL